MLGWRLVRERNEDEMLRGASLSALRCAGRETSTKMTWVQRRDGKVSSRHNHNNKQHDLHPLRGLSKHRTVASPLIREKTARKTLDAVA
jgi:hypothetical protein